MKTLKAPAVLAMVFLVSPSLCGAETVNQMVNGRMRSYDVTRSGDTTTVTGYGGGQGLSVTTGQKDSRGNTMILSPGQRCPDQTATDILLQGSQDPETAEDGD